MNKFFEILDSPIPTDSEQYNRLVENIVKFKRFQIDDIYRNTNRGLKKPDKLTRKQVIDTLRLLLKKRIIKYDLKNQLMILNQTNTNQKIKQ